MEQYDLCKPCAVIRELEGQTLKVVASGVDNKVICADCGKHRYGATYELTATKTAKDGKSNG